MVSLTRPPHAPSPAAAWAGPSSLLTLLSLLSLQGVMQGTIPYLGTFLTDLVMLDTAMKDFLDVCTTISVLCFLSFLCAAWADKQRAGPPRVLRPTLHPARPISNTAHPPLSAHGSHRATEWRGLEGTSGDLLVHPPPPKQVQMPAAFDGPLLHCPSAGMSPLQGQRAGGREGWEQYFSACSTLTFGSFFFPGWAHQL